jgi:hypothetical protein
VADVPTGLSLNLPQDTKKNLWDRKSGSRRPKQVNFTADVPYLQSLFLKEVIDINFKSLQKTTVYTISWDSTFIMRENYSQ